MAITPEEKAALMVELLEEIEQQKEAERRNKRIATKLLDEIEGREDEFSPVKIFQLRAALSTLLRAVYGVNYANKISADREEQARAFIGEVLELVLTYQRQTEKGA